MARMIACGIFAVFVALGSWWLHYYLPRNIVVEMSGISSKREEVLALRVPTPSDKPIDVYFINAKRENGAEVVFRNVDTKWGWPPYFKFSAAEIQAKAQDMAKEQVQITYYGWRNKWLEMFPNVLSLRLAHKGDPSISWVRNSVFTLWWLLIIIVFPRYYSLFSQKKKS